MIDKIRKLRLDRNIYFSFFFTWALFFIISFASYFILGSLGIVFNILKIKYYPDLIISSSLWGILQGFGIAIQLIIVRKS